MCLPACRARAAKWRGAADGVPRRAEGAEVAALLILGPARPPRELRWRIPRESGGNEAGSDPEVRSELVAARPLQGAVRPPPRAGGAPRGGADDPRGRAIADRDDLRRGAGGLRVGRLAPSARGHVLVPVRDRGRGRGPHRLHVRVPGGRSRGPRRQAGRAAGRGDRRGRLRDVHPTRRVRGRHRGARGSRRAAARRRGCGCSGSARSSTPSSRPAHSSARSSCSSTTRTRSER